MLVAALRGASSLREGFLQPSVVRLLKCLQRAKHAMQAATNTEMTKFLLDANFVRRGLNFKIVRHHAKFALMASTNLEITFRALCVITVVLVVTRRTIWSPARVVLVESFKSLMKTLNTVASFVQLARSTSVTTLHAMNA
jgi:hypothetical protein